MGQRRGNGSKDFDRMSTITRLTSVQLVVEHEQVGLMKVRCLGRCQLPVRANVRAVVDIDKKRRLSLATQPV